MSKPRSLDEILGSFGAEDGATEDLDTMIGIWLPREYKTRYDHLQKLSRRGFSKTLRELVQAAIDAAEKRIA